LMCRGSSFSVGKVLVMHTPTREQSD